MNIGESQHLRKYSTGDVVQIDGLFCKVLSEQNNGNIKVQLINSSIRQEHSGHSTAIFISDHS